MSALAHELDVNAPTHALLAPFASEWADGAAANDDGTCAGHTASTASTAGAAGVACEPDASPCATSSPWSMTDRTRHPLHASATGCPGYPGELWCDVLEYRAIRAHVLGGARATPRMRERLVELEQRLRGESGDVRRHDLRFACRFAAMLELEGGERLATHVLDASVGGAKLAYEGRAREGDAVVLELAAERVAGAIALPGRVIWASEGKLGLMFAGAAQWR